MNNPLVIAIDSSTTATKAVVIDTSGNVISMGRAEIELLSPQMNHYEHDPREWWGSTHQAITEAVSSLSESDRERIAAIGITHQRESFALIDEDGNPIRPAILWLDSRAGEQIKEFGSDHIHELSGKPADTTPALYKLAWLKKHEPEALSQAFKLVDVHAYLSHALTGKWVSAEGSIDTLNLFDIAARTFSEELLEIAGLRPDQMVEFTRAGDVIGTLLPSLANEWRLSPEVVLVAGVGDGQAAGLGTAAIDPDVAYVNIGTSVVSGTHSNEYQFDRAYRTLIGGIPGTYVLEIVQNSGSVLYNWFRKNLGDPALEGGLDPALEAEASRIAPGSDALLTLPHWNAGQSPDWDPFATGAMVGFTTGHTRAHVFRSIVEGTAMLLAENLNRVQEVTGRKLVELRATGGSARSPFIRQIFADATGLPIVMSEVDELSAHGAAMIAMAGVGAYPGVESAARAMAHLGERTEPNPQAHEKYVTWMRLHSRIYPLLAELMTDMKNVED